jgi:hypothetical protein
MIKFYTWQNHQKMKYCISKDYLLNLKIFILLINYKCLSLDILEYIILFLNLLFLDNNQL